MRFFYVRLRDVCSIRVNERVYVFWALCTYTYVKNASLKNSLKSATNYHK